MQKNQKIKANAPLAEKELRYAKMPQTRCAQTVGIFDASLRSFS
jgi:DNA-binding protein Fis